MAFEKTSLMAVLKKRNTREGTHTCMAYLPLKIRGTSLLIAGRLNADHDFKDL